MSSLHHVDVIENLQKLGLTRHEAIIYLSVLRREEASAGEVLRDVKLHREQVYRALKRLVDNGLLVQFEKRKRNYYSAIDPKVLVNQVRTKVALAESLQPYLEQLHQNKPQIIKVTEGEEGILLQFEDVYQTLETDGEYLVLGGIGQPFYDLLKDYAETYQKKFAKKNISGRVLVYEESRYPTKSLFGERLSFKKLQRPGASPTSTVIYRNKVGIDLIEPGNITVITIENKRVADSFRQTFEALWKW